MVFPVKLRAVPAVVLAMLPFAPAVEAAAKPNIVIILADDMGYSDPGCFGGEIDTPHLDRLAAGGLRLTRVYNGGMCVPSRTSLLSGLWHTNAGNGMERGITLAQALHTAGYRTLMTGKWHLNGQPTGRGFDRFFGFLGGYSSYFEGSDEYRLDDQPFHDFPPGFHATDAFTDYAMDFIGESKASYPGQPFFLYLAYNAPHNPLQAEPAGIAKYRGRYLGGWQALREGRFARQKEIGFMPASADLPAYPENFPQWDSLSPAQQDLEDLRRAVYAAMIDRMDRNIGRLLAFLDEKGLRENTIIFFMSDNGADPFAILDEPMLKAGKLPGDPQSNWQIGMGWAYANNAPLRLYKISQHDGGVRSAMIVNSPALSARDGKIDPTPLHFVDFMPTLLDLAGARYPEKFEDHPVPPGDGLSFAPLLTEGTPMPPRKLYFQHMDNRGMIDGKWRLSEVDASGWELHDLDADPTQAHDLAAQEPDRVRKMDGTWTQWWDRFNPHPYQPVSTDTTPHNVPQGDRGTGDEYIPSAMPARLSDRYPLPADSE